MSHRALTNLAVWQNRINPLGPGERTPSAAELRRFLIEKLPKYNPHNVLDHGQEELALLLNEVESEGDEEAKPHEPRRSRAHRQGSHHGGKGWT